MEEQLDIFFQLLISAITSIAPEYYQTAYTNINFQRRPRNVGNQVFEDGVLYRFGERVLCYELYHQLQNLIYNFRNVQPDFLEGCFLQGELKKRQIMDILDHYNIEPLGAGYTPDLLMHTPSNFDFNAFVIEVKVSPDLEAFDVNYDIVKLIQFIQRYNYQRAAFLAVNTSMQQLTHMVRNGADTEELRNSTTVEISSRIHVITVERLEGTVETTMLSEILNLNNV